jgi:hypothetical protein
MTKNKKIEYINAVNDKFINARNHGHNGNNWWYPKENTIAYNVKMYHGFVSIGDIKAKMTDRQKEYYNKDEYFYELLQETIQRYANDFSNELDATDGIKSSGYAGRSGGWLEVEYINNIDIEAYTSKEIDSVYQTAKELDELETKTGQKIKDAKESLEKYLDSKEYLQEIIDNLLSDDDIADIYKSKAKDLLDKLK